jgi:hypothetical protein
MGAVKPLARTERDDMEIGQATKPWDEETARNVRLPKWMWAKLAVIADREAAAGKKSPRTRQRVSVNDALYTAAEALIGHVELAEGKIVLPAMPPGTEPPAPAPAPAKKPASKKGGKA